MKPSPMKKELSREQLLTVAIAIAERDGYRSLTRDGLAEQAGVANGKINYVFSTMMQLRHAVMCAAVAREIKPIIAQGLANADPIATDAPEWLKRESLELLMGE